MISHSVSMRCFRRSLQVIPRAAAAVALAVAASAQTLVAYDPVGPQDSGQPLFPTTVAPVVTATDLVQMGFVGAWGNTNVWPVGQLGAATSTLDPAQYVEFGITPNATIQLSSLSYSRSSYLGEGNRAAAIRTNLDGYMTDVDVITGLPATGVASIDFDLTGLAPITAPLTLRIYFYDAPSTGLDWVDLLSTAGGGTGLVLEGVSGGIGTPYCTNAVPNSSGQPGLASATGSTSIAVNSVTLMATGLPPGQFGIFVVSDAQTFNPGAGGNSNGNLCVGGAIGRYSRPGEILSAGTAGEFTFALDLTAIRRPTVDVATVAGDTWNFQAWHRDSVGVGSNFTSAIGITFN